MGKAVIMSQRAAQMMMSALARKKGERDQVLLYKRDSRVLIYYYAFSSNYGKNDKSFSFSFLI